MKKKAEFQLLKKYDRKLKSAILIAPHHGSQTSSSLEFLQAVAPDWILIPVGHLNRYRHPSKTVIKRYQSLQTHWLESGNHGAIAVLFADELLAPVSYRDSYRRYWHQLTFAPE